MSNLDLAVFLVAGLLGALGIYRPEAIRWIQAAWAVVALWALLALLHVIA